MPTLPLPLPAKTANQTHSTTVPTTYNRRVGNGSCADIYRISEDRVLKTPKIYPESYHPDLEYSNFMHREEIQNEKLVFERLGNHEGVIRCLNQHSDSIVLVFANQGDMENYIEHNPCPKQELRVQWVKSLIDAFCYIHSRRVVHQDIALRNILLHNDSPKICDFGQSAMLPLDTDMEQFCVYETTPQVELLALGSLLYSIIVWKCFEYDYFENNRLPEPQELPTTNGIPFGSIIRKCWSGQYASMEALMKDFRAVSDRQNSERQPLTWRGALLVSFVASFPYVIHWLGVARLPQLKE
ncbi:hypothetical protein LOZ12_002184 [Ophidiomyces ophidiicola]|uniref:Uncharacterized protein n=1 Tax=Ophidiomyces ophidiicola TaxID=1387563 RepID=A0ACB8UYD2_9EURO|nr:hypothetical protein LOZ64_001371 [Ophidiomyces ophidiicola]KAI1949325.1 hypothetical protein LOZ62_002289 [Ophidiomyces ophidiicola]KAI1970965.1 hypothetical protein LOZ56_003377 [Ophidiomyces ophidiicola]KAI2006004.1 hypothetical protein LOZ50_003395 [Ophidiomyces ophidiicola]KAI2030744.1 hypothetical protein LOZ45_001526 [Ophidiomyces ophidiicola]